MYSVFQSKMIKKVVCFLTLILLLSVFSGCAKEDNNAAGNAAEQSGISKREEKPVLKIGQAGRTDKFEITVTKVTKADEWINAPAQGREYVVVSIKVTNISNEDESISVNDFQYINDENGTKENYARTTGVKADPDTFGAENIAPGDTFEGSIVYDMPIEMSRIELYYIEGYSSNPTLRFEINK